MNEEETVTFVKNSELLLGQTDRHEGSSARV
jgi:hypothetical protein